MGIGAGEPLQFPQCRKENGATAIRVRENADYWKGLEFDQAFRVRWQRSLRLAVVARNLE